MVVGEEKRGTGSGRRRGALSEEEETEEELRCAGRVVVRCRQHQLWRRPRVICS